MANQLDIGAFLSEQVSEGTVDSHGEFTVSHHQAARKLAKFALPRSTAWVTKLIQAANRWECGAVQIRQSATETLFHFSFPNLQALPVEEELVASILSGRVGGKTALDAFCTALRSLVEQAELSFILVVDDTQLTPRPIYAGHHYSDMSEKARLHPRFRPKPGLSLTVYHRPPAKSSDEGLDLVALVNRMRSYVPIIEELDRYCYVSGIPVVLDGRRVDNLIESPSLAWSENHRPLMFLGLKGLEHSPSYLPTPIGFEEKIVSLLSHSRRMSRSYGGEKSFQAVAIVSTRTFMGVLDFQSRKRWSRLYWVNDGVIVHEEPLNVDTKGVRLLLLANAQGLDTDLTGFALINSEPLQTRRQELFLEASQILDSRRVLEANFFREDRDADSFADEEHDVQEATRRRIKWLLKGSGTGLTLTVFNPVLGVPATIAALATTYGRKSKDPRERILQSRKDLEKKIQDDLAVLRDYLKIPQIEVDTQVEDDNAIVLDEETAPEAEDILKKLLKED